MAHEEDKRPDQSDSEQPPDGLLAPFIAPETFLPELQKRLARRAVYATGQSSLEKLSGALASSEWEIRAAALKGIRAQTAHVSLSLVRKGLADEHPLVRLAAVRALGNLEGSLPPALLLRSLEDEDWRVRELAILVLGSLDEPRLAALSNVARLLTRMLDDQDRSVRTAAAEVLERVYPTIWRQIQTENTKTINNPQRNMWQGNIHAIDEDMQKDEKKRDTGGINMQRMPDLPHHQENEPGMYEYAGQMGASSSSAKRRVARRTLIASIGVGIAALGTAASYVLLSGRLETAPNNAGLGSAPPAKATPTPTDTPTPVPTEQPAPTQGSSPRKLGDIITVYQRQSLTVPAARWSPDSRLVASASYDKTVQIWQASSGALVFTYRGHSDEVNSVDWSPDGNYLVSGGGNISVNQGQHDYSVQIWNASAGQVRKLVGPTDYINPVRWSPDGKYIAAACYDRRAYVWEAASGRLVTTYTGHSESLTGLAWSPDSQRLVTSSADTSVQIWQAATGQHILSYSGHQGSGVVLAVAWSPDGSRIASSAGGAASDAVVKVWAADTGQTLYTYKGHVGSAMSAGFPGLAALTALLPSAPKNPLSGSGIGVFSVAWSPDGKRIASGGGGNDGTVQIWSPTSHQRLYTFPSTNGGSYINSLEWSPDATRMASTSGSQTTIWQAQV